MSALAVSGADGFLARYEGLKARLPGDAAEREAAAGAFRAAGLPGVRQEAWRYTNLKPVAEVAFHEAMSALADCAGLLALLPDIDAPRLIFVDGRFRADLSSLPDGVDVGTFARAPGFGTLAHPERDALVALNTMLAEDGATISVPEGRDGGTLVLASLGSDAAGHPVAFHPRHSIHLARGAKLTVVDVSVGTGTYLHNPVISVQVEPDAALTHVRLQDESPSAFHLAMLYADVAARGTYDSFSLSLGARLARSEVRVNLGGSRGLVHLNAAQLLGGVQHGDFTTVVRHDAPACASRQTVKNVLAGRARGVFQGRIEVARVAQKTDGYQMNQALLLSPEAEIDSKPELEIFADDVKCSHGATVGELDPAQLFYLRSRGVPEAEARTILVRAFLAEALDVVADESVRAALDVAVQRWWERQAS